MNILVTIDLDSGIPEPVVPHIPADGKLAVALTKGGKSFQPASAELTIINPAEPDKAISEPGKKAANGYLFAIARSELPEAPCFEARIAAGDEGTSFHLRP